MPYVPSKKTDGKSTDRETLDAVIERLANDAITKISTNFSLITIYKSIFIRVANFLHSLNYGYGIDEISAKENIEANLAQAIYDIGAKYGYQGAFLGELNYAITRFIQRVPQLKVQNGSWTQELCYWLYAATVEALTCASYEARAFNIGVSGVFEDIKDEYKRRVNTAYEAEQIIKSGDCYDTPYYTKVVNVSDSDGNAVGYMEIMLKRDQNTISQDVLDGHLTLHKK